MAVFKYKARDRRGELLSGEMEADTAELVADQLFHSDITPIEIESSEGQKKKEKPRLQLWSEKVTLDELIMVSRQFHTLMRSGVPILRGLDTMVATTKNRTLSETFKEVAADLRSGRELSSALARHPAIFTPLFVNMIEVGETTGQLDESFKQLAEYLEMEKSTRNRVRTALRYPMIVIGAVIVAIVIINIWVIPAFAQAFNRFGSDLPWATQFLMATSGFFVNGWKEMLVASVAGFLAFRFWLKTDSGSYRWSRTLLRLPLVGDILMRAILARFGRSVSMSLRAGVTMVQALTSVSGVLENRFMQEKILSMRNGIENGDSIARTAAATGLFTPLVLQMITIGEETGKVDDLLNETAEHYEREVEYELSRLSDALEPIIITIIGVMVLILALGVFLPMWDLSSAAFNK